MKRTSSDLLHVICLAHLIICLAFICVPTDHPVELGGVLVYPSLQWAYATFCCFCIVSIIAAGVGNIYNIAVHLDIYWYVLLVSALADVAWLVLFLVFGHACHTMPSGTPKNPHLMKVVSCAVTSGGVLVCLVLLLALKAVGMVAAAKAAVEARSRECEELLPYLNKAMGHLAAVEGLDALQSTAQDAAWQQQQLQPQQAQGPGFRNEPSLSFRSAPPSAPASARVGPFQSYPTYGTVDNLSSPELGQAAEAARTAAEALSGSEHGEEVVAAEEVASNAPSQASSSSRSERNPFSSVIFGTGELPRGMRPEDPAPTLPAVGQP